MIELIQTRRDLFREVIEDALENVGLANTIMEGRKNNFVSADEVFGSFRLQVRNNFLKNHYLIMILRD